LLPGNADSTIGHHAGHLWGMLPYRGALPIPARHLGPDAKSLRVVEFIN